MRREHEKKWWVIWSDVEIELLLLFFFHLNHLLIDEEMRNQKKFIVISLLVSWVSMCIYKYVRNKQAI